MNQKYKFKFDGLIRKMVMSGFLMTNSENLLTHNHDMDENLDLSTYLNQLKNKHHLSLSLAEEIELLKRLAEFDLGRFLLKNKGLNGYWTAYIILHGPQKKDVSPLEEWILKNAPVVKATQERFKIFQTVIQKNLNDNMVLASVPCGLMDDLLGLDYTYLKNIKLVGMDLDERSLDLGRKNADLYKRDNVKFIKKDAWHLDDKEKYDLITSNGLNIYQPDNEKVVDLYREFYKALKSGGKLVISFLTPPPAVSEESPWKNFKKDDLLKQKAIFSDIIGASWQAFRTEKQTREQLESIGFDMEEIIYDSQCMFPTVVAKKGITRE